MYIHMYVYTCVYIYIYTYIHHMYAAISDLLELGGLREGRSGHGAEAREEPV